MYIYIHVCSYQPAISCLIYVLNIRIFSIAHAHSILTVGEAKGGKALPIYTDQPVNSQAFILSKVFCIDFNFPAFTLTLLAYKQAGVVGLQSTLSVTLFIS